MINLKYSLMSFQIVTVIVLWLIMICQIPSDYMTMQRLSVTSEENGRHEYVLLLLHKSVPTHHSHRS